MIKKLLKNFEERIIHTYFSSLYDYIVRNRLSPLNKNLPLLPLIENKITLDLGCGTAHLPIKLAKMRSGLFILGLDISKKLLGVALRRARIEGLTGRSLKFICGDAHFLPLPDSSVDFVISTGSLHHWNDVPRVLNEIFRVLKSNGQVRIYDQRKPISLKAVKSAMFNYKFIGLGLSALPDKKIEEYFGKSRFINYRIIKDDASVEIRAFKN
ncbi:MAG: class I SAM-dependent methyltransferase [Candidatus Omnitrophota bacterium]